MKFDINKYPNLFLINNPIKLRQTSKENLINLCKELRKFLIECVSQSSGHFASGLGTVELTVALHYVYNTPFDRLIWDTGHQTYPHKILTERRDQMLTIRQRNGLHPFPWREESEYDQLSVGHSSTSISAGLGMSIASKYEQLNRRIVCVIGDGGITAGMAFEAMNHAGYIKPDLLVILNDNRMSISENVGALSKTLSRITINKKYKQYLYEKEKNTLFNISSKKQNNKNCNKKDNEELLTQGAIFKELGFNYIGPIDGHNILNLVEILKKMRLQKGPQLLHVITKKGYGYKPAEHDPIGWHAVPKFNPKIGKLPKSNSKYPSYSNVFGNWLCTVANYDKKLIAITPAMCEGSGMFTFSKKYPKQYFDVAISEQHAVTFAAGLAIGGYSPVVAIYSTFLQRAYDQVIHDIAIQKLPVLFAIDRAGIVGCDGQTHQGAFDLSYLRCIPNMVIMTPSNENEFWLMLYTGYNYKLGPSAIRYPRGGDGIGVTLDKSYSIPLGKGVICRKGIEIAILNFGALLPQAKKASKLLNATLVDMRFVKPLDESLIRILVNSHKVLVTIEENVIKGGAGSGVNEFVMRNKILIPILNIGLPDYFIPQGNQEDILSDLNLNGIGIFNQIKDWIS